MALIQRQMRSPANCPKLPLESSSSSAFSLQPASKDSKSRACAHRIGFLKPAPFRRLETLVEFPAPPKIIPKRFSIR